MLNQDNQLSRECKINPYVFRSSSRRCWRGFLQIHLQRYNPEIPQDEDRFGTTGRTQLYTVLSKDNYLDEVQARRAKYDKLPTEDGKDLPKSISFGIA